MGIVLAVLIVVGIGMAYSTFLKMVMTAGSPLWVTHRRMAIDRMVRRELSDLDRQYAEICSR